MTNLKKEPDGLEKQRIRYVFEDIQMTLSALSIFMFNFVDASRVFSYYSLLLSLLNLFELTNYLKFSVQINSFQFQWTRTIHSLLYSFMLCLMYLNNLKFWVVVIQLFLPFANKMLYVYDRILGDFLGRFLVVW